MLGRLLELSLVIDDVGTAWQRWQALGFVDAAAGDVWPHPYGVVACRGLAIGLHAQGDEPLVLTFVREDVAQLERELSLRLIGVDRARLDPEGFNFIELREPGGMLLRVVEARTFSPPAAAPADTALGQFIGTSLPSGDLAEARGFWERLDYEVSDTEDPWDGIAVAGLPLRCHAAATVRDPVLMFAGDGELPAAPRDAGIVGGPPLRGLRSSAHRVLLFREGFAVLQLAHAR